ncbi:hypothetical protein MPTK1_2g13650 [Marchantia polymorpha subsp. ruderalis]|uniref:Uncharacterized protein n=1 Tax=Marchantia polymorpha TaxID=3197 RepID=A0A2R6XAK9_MARPO|nr:hypothetical protein MARPO_0026s0006 [Marchantia polymorpha]BBN02216.1 hypothetical protein Mp_2g13650 [Marchantia polymorpha subsp. ruderalis]|eukprot:PTQ43102.1 hypothetical protein MARPO_0026s0006 [Marchantia polymorpha]
MCYPVKCATCSLTTWAGCGKHVPSVYENIPKGQACMCKGWPGVNLPKQEICTDAPKAAPITTTNETGSVTK